MAEHDKHDTDHPPMAVLFQTREEARAAIKALHKAKYTHTWLGTTSVAEGHGGEVLTVESGGFFSGTQSLVDSLVSRGIHGDAARDLEMLVEPGNALVTLDPKDKDPQGALDIIAAHGGQGAEARSALDWSGWPSTTAPTSEIDLDTSDEAWEELRYTRR